MSKIFRRLALVLVALSIGAQAAEVYQYAVPAIDAKGREITAFLWVPPKADRLRGVLIGGQTLMEPAFARDPAIRAVCAEEKLAIIYFYPSLDATFEYWQRDSAVRLQKALDDLAQESGYREVSVAPLFPFGHSVSSLFASRVVCWAPERCFGALCFKGGLDVPADDPKASIAGVPILVIKGQFEEFGPGPSGVLRDFEDRETAWKGMRDGLLRRRAADERCLVSYLVESGATHFAWSERLAPFTANFLREAARQRIPDWPRDAAAAVRLRCRAVDVSGGALSGAPGEPPIAAEYARFTGERSRSFWHFSPELARAADAFHADLLAPKAPQFVTFAEPASGKPLFVGHDLRLKLAPSWVGPGTFRVAGTLLDRPPDKYPKTDGTRAAHGEGPVQFRVFGGAIEQISPTEFRVAPNGREPLGGNILAWHPGGANVRYAEQQGRVSLPERLTKGRPQSFAFPELPALDAASAPVPLRAVSDAGLSVHFYVESGPAVIEGDTLRMAEIPARARFPMKLVIVGTQYGSAVEPMVQSAEPVRRTLTIAAPPTP